MAVMEIQALGRTATGPRVGIQRCNDQDVLDKMARMIAIEEIGQEYARLADAVKKRFRATGQSVHLVGGVLVTVKVGSSTVYNVPEEIKQQYAGQAERISVSWAALRATGQMEGQLAEAAG